MVEIKSRFTGKVIKKIDAPDLSGADLSRADLSGADLSGADLSGADLSRADLSGADLSGADLSGADLYRANLSETDLSRADLSGADLSGADLSRADLSGADLEFWQFPSIRLISSINLGEVSGDIGLELMRRDAWGHPHPEKLDVWAKGGPCPYNDTERFWFFNPDPKIWVSGPPQMTDRDLILAICKEKGWGIRGYYTPEKKESK